MSEVDNINPYLTSGHSIFIGRRANPLSEDFPVLRYGSMPNDGGNLVLDKYEVDQLLFNNPHLRTIIKEFIGSFEFINRQKRWCLYIKDKDLSDFEVIPEISKRLSAVTQHRISSTESSTRALANMPNKFYYSAYEETDAIIIPRVSSERRKYVPIGIVSPDVIISDSALAMYNAKIWILGVVMSYIHMVWMKNIGGKLKTDYRYSPTLVYNNFPFPKISAEKKQEIESAAEVVLITRENYPEKTLAELYDPDKMPQDLREAHAKLDDIVESCYPGYPFATDEARLECLFKLYEKMTKTNK